ncbi:dynamin family protein [Luteococcus peritonei]|uniref:Dynamin family protein n=1 Tax=Luteococcus peritonei TaxID=88874 RepID=A0ABW4RX64_9ACTN
MSSSTRLTQALTELRESLAPVRLPLPLPQATEQARSARDMQRQLDDYILPRLATIEAPLLAVVGGSTGAGKSTLVNSLIGRIVTTPGVIRPTTKSPVLICHPADVKWFENDRILPGLVRSRSSSHDQNTLQIVEEASIPQGLAIIDAPDVDSVVEQNRNLAAQLLQAADLWVFVTSAARYADAVPWDFLKAAVDRSAAVAVVLDRIPPAAMNQVPPHLGQLMTERGLADSPLFAVPETETDAEGLLPDAAVSPIRTWLATLAADQASRQRIVLQTLDGAIGSLAAKAPGVATAVDAQAEALTSLREDAAASYREAVRQVSVQSADGTLLRGEVLARWQDFVGTGEFMKAMEQKIGWVRDRLFATIKGTPPEAEGVKVAVESGLEALVREEGEAAAERAEAAWRATPFGRDVLRNHTGGDLSRASAGFPDAVARAIRDWQGDVMELVSQEGMDKRAKARYLALGVNGASAALMLVVFFHTAGLSGAEVGIAGGSVVLAQRVLEAVFGDDAVRKLANQAKSDLDARVSAVMADELRRFDDAIAELGGDPEQAERIREAVEQVQSARHGGYDDLAGTALPAAAAPAAVEPADEQPALGSAEDFRTASTPVVEPAQREQVQLNTVEGPAQGEVVDAEIVHEEQ